MREGGLDNSNCRDTVIYVFRKNKTFSLLLQHYYNRAIKIELVDHIFQ